MQTGDVLYGHHQPQMATPRTSAEQASVKYNSPSSEGIKLIRPQAFRSGEGSSGSKKSKHAMAAVALDWQHGSLSNKNCEGSATSDEDHPRLVPRKGAGPELRSGGHEIDEYLMRLLRAGSAHASEAAFYHNETVHSRPEVSVAFPAGWNNSTPWYMPGGQPKSVSGSGGSGSQQPNAPTVKPTMPPPAFPAQPWQGSRLGPLPPIYPLPSNDPNLNDATTLVHGMSNGVGHISEAKSDGSMGQKEQQQHQQQQHQEAEKHQFVAREGKGPIAEVVRRQVGDVGFTKIRSTMMKQQETLHQQVADLHRMLRRHQESMIPSDNNDAVQQQPKQQDSYNHDMDPKSVLISSFGNGSGSGSASLPSIATATNAAGRAASLQCLQSQEHVADAAAAAAAAGTPEPPRAGARAERAAALQETARVAAMANCAQQLREGLPHATALVQQQQPLSPHGDAVALYARAASLNDALQAGELVPPSYFSSGSLPQELGGYQTDSALYTNQRSRSHPGGLNFTQKGSAIFGGSLPASMPGLGSLIAAQQALAGAQGYDPSGCSPRIAGHEENPIEHTSLRAEQAASFQQQQQQQQMFGQQQQQQQAMVQHVHQEQQNAMCFAAQQQAQQQSMMAGACQQQKDAAAAAQKQQFSSQTAGCAAWFAEVMRQLGIVQPQHCMPFDPKWAWFYHFGQPNFSAANAMNAAAYNFYQQDMANGGNTAWWQQAMNCAMVNGNACTQQQQQQHNNMQMSAMQAGEMYGEYTQPQAGMAPQAAAASQESARDSSHCSVPMAPGPAVHQGPRAAQQPGWPARGQERPEACREDEATSSLGERGMKRRR